MASMKVTLSALEKYAVSHRDGCTALLETAQMLHRTVAQMYHEVQESYNSICVQHARAFSLWEESASKEKAYQSMMLSAESERSRYSDEMSYISSHPVARTSTDTEGNVSTYYEVDRAALRAAESGRNMAHTMYLRHSESAGNAALLSRGSEQNVTRLGTLKQAICSVMQSIENDMYEIKKYIDALIDESQYNLYALGTATESVRDYLASKAIFLPNGANYEVYASE